MPPPAPKSSAPAPPKSAAPPPPPGSNKKKLKKVKKVEPIQKSKSYNKPNKKSQNNAYKPKDDSAYELSKTAASAAGAAAKAAFFSFGSKVKKDVKSFTKNELEHAGVDTSKPIIKKKTANKPKEKSAPPQQLKSYNMDWKNKNKNGKTKSNEFKSNTKSKSYSPNPPKKKNNSSTLSKPKSKGTKKPPPAPKKKKAGSNGLANRLAMFEEKDRQAGKTKPPSKKKSGSNGFFNKKNKNNNNNKKKPPAPKKKKPSSPTSEKNLRPSIAAKNKKKSPPLQSKQAPPSELKSVNVDWKEQRKKMANVFKKKDEDKDSKMKVKTKELFGQMKKVKASVTAESADKNRAAPKKMEFSLFSKSKSADTGDKGGEKESKTNPGPPPPPPPDSQPNFKSKSYSPQQGSTNGGLPPPTFDIADVNKKIAKPEDYNEIQFKAVDPMELRRQQKRTGAGRLGPRTAGLVSNKPTSASSIGAPEMKSQSPPKQASRPPPVPQIAKKKKSKPGLPSAPPPKPKKASTKVGVLEVMPTNQENGWVFNAGGMFTVSSKDVRKLQNSGIFEGAPVMFDAIDKQASNIRLLRKVEENVAIECLTKKKNGKTKHDAKYFIHETEFEFNGNLSTNAFEMPKDCSAKSIAGLSENIINAFMNTDGGILYIGIDSSWNVKGVATDSINLQEIKKLVTNIVGRFDPRLDNSDLKKIKFSTKAILTKDGSLKEDILVLKITVPGPFKDDNNDKIIFATANGEKYKKNLNYIMKVVM